MIHLKLKQLRKAKGLSQNEMAQLLHKSQNAYSMVESGKSKLDAALVPEICKLFNIYPSELFDYEDMELAGTLINLKDMLKILKNELDKKNLIIENLLKFTHEKTTLEEQNENLKKLLNILNKYE